MNDVCIKYKQMIKKCRGWEKANRIFDHEKYTVQIQWKTDGPSEIYNKTERNRKE